MQNRIIKFRAWDAKSKYMIQPEYGHWISFDGVAYTEPDRHGDTSNIEVQKTKDLILMQFTGLHDKNGVEIYEGDIMKDWVSGTNWQVKFGRVANMGFTGWYCINYNHVSIVPLNGDYDTNINSKVEIIGNIYQTPELLTPTP